MSRKDKTLNRRQLKSQMAAPKIEPEGATAKVEALESKPLPENSTEGTPEQSKEKEKILAIPEIIKDQLVLISSLILAVGIISTHTYYAVFGIKYQFLDLPTFHIVYHGLLILVDAPYLLAPYAIAVGWLGLDNYASLNNWRTFLLFRVPLTYVLIIILFAMTFPLAQRAGRKQAEADLFEGTSTLPKIVNMELSNGEKYGLGDQYRLLVVDSTYTIIFKPLDPGDNSTLPNIKRFSKGQINVIETIR